MAIGIPGETVRAGGGQVATGQQYAQQIAGGMPMSQVIAPGVSYSPDQPSGYTQADLNMISAGPAPVMPIAPTTGEVATIPNQMPYAPPGTTVADLLPNDLIQNYLQFIPNLGLPSDIPFQNIAADTSFAPELSQDGNLFVPSKFDLDVEAILEGVDPEKLAEIDLSNIDLPQSPGRPGIDYFPEPRDPFIVSDFFDLPGQAEAPSLLAEPAPASVAAPVVPFEGKNVFELRQETESMVNPYNQLQGNYAKGLFDIPDVPQAPVMPSLPAQQPMNFTGLPNIPVPPAAQVYIPPPPPPPAYTQPRVEDIVAPIRSGSPRNFQQPGLFSLV